MYTRNRINDIMYGQNWVEQMREARRVIHYVPIYDSGSRSPYDMVEALFDCYIMRLPNPELWERRKRMFRYLSQDFPLIK